MEKTIQDLIKSNIITSNELKMACLSYNFTRIMALCDFHGVFFTDEDSEEIMIELGYI